MNHVRFIISTKTHLHSDWQQNYGFSQIFVSLEDKKEKEYKKDPKILGDLQYDFSLYLNINQDQLYSWFGEWVMHNAENGIVLY